MIWFKPRTYFLCITFCFLLCPKKTSGVHFRQPKELIQSPLALKRSRFPAHLRHLTTTTEFRGLRQGAQDFNGPGKRIDIVIDNNVKPFPFAIEKLPVASIPVLQKKLGLVTDNGVDADSHLELNDDISHKDETDALGLSADVNDELPKRLDNDMLNNNGVDGSSHLDVNNDTDYEYDSDDNEVYQIEEATPKLKKLKNINYYVQYPLQEPGFDLTVAEMTKFKIWSHGNVPYYIDSLSFSKAMRDRIRAFLSEASSLTGLRFWELPSLPKQENERWVLFINRRKLLVCEDYTVKDFNITGVQDVVLGYDCINDLGKMAGLVLALSGVPPMHNSPDRDLQITIQTDEIIPEKEHLFDKMNNNDWIFHNLPYDFNSAGHYNLFKYTKSGKATIKPKEYLDIDIGYANGFSPIDILKIRMLYTQIVKPEKAEVDTKHCKKMYNYENYIKKQDSDFNNKELALPKASVRPKPAQYLSGCSDC